MASNFPISPFYCRHHAGRAFLRLKEYVIGITVFDRKESYDPRLDPIVRVEAVRLREKVKRYYETIGQSDLVRIECPNAAMFLYSGAGNRQRPRRWWWTRFPRLLHQSLCRSAGCGYRL